MTRINQQTTLVLPVVNKVKTLDMKRVGAIVKEETLDELKDIAEETGICQTQLIRMLLEFAIPLVEIRK